MQAYFISEIPADFRAFAPVGEVCNTHAVAAPRSFTRRAMIFSAVAGVGVASMAAGVFAASNTMPEPPRSVDATPAQPAVVNPGPALIAPSDADRREWALFRAQMMSEDGRIVDGANHGESHSEGQGLGMLFAVAFDDHAAFELLHAWTKRHLLRTDGLHAWRFLPNTPNPVSDPNNASDGDIYLTVALQRAARRWNRPDYAAAATRTARAIHDKLLAAVGNRLVLLPASFGFDHPDRVVVNLSYYIFPLLEELNGAYPSEQWRKLYSDGVALAQAARFGRWSLPPDWLDISKAGGAVTLATTFPPRFSWDAVRVPLFLAWAGEAPEVVQAAGAFWAQNANHAPAWVDLRSGAVAEYAVCPGVQAIAELATMARAGGKRVGKTPSVANDAYFSSALTLLSRMARAEMAAHATQA